MFTNETVKEYIGNLNNTKLFDDLKPDEQDKVIFSSSELLKDYFSVEDITERAIALQVLYSIEGEDEEFAKLKRQGVTKYSVKGVSVSFSGSGISGDVIRILSDVHKAKVKRLI